MEEMKPEGAGPRPAKKTGLWIGIAIVIVVVAILLAAVLGGFFAPPPPERGPALRIGTLLSLTGGLDDFGPGNTKGARLAIEEINAAGGVLGQSIEMFVEDDQTNPVAAAAAATKLITNLRVNAIVGAQFSGGTIGSLTVAQENGVPLVSPSATSPALSDLTLTKGWFFRTTPNDNLQGAVAGQYMFTNLSYTSIAIMNRNDPYGNGLAGSAKAKFEALGGTVTDVVIIDPSKTDFTSDITTLFSGNPEAVYFIAFTDEGTTVMRQWQQGLSANPGWNRPWIFAEGLKSAALMNQLADPSIGVDVTKIIGTSPVSGEGSVYAAFRDRYLARFFEAVVQYTDNAYDGAYLIALAAQKAGATDGTSIKNTLRSVATPPGTVIRPGEWAKALSAIAAGEDLDWEGAAGAENFDANGDVLGPYEIWNVTFSTAANLYELDRKAFIPESIIQLAPTLPAEKQSAPTSNGFLQKVQAIAASRWD